MHSFTRRLRIQTQVFRLQGRHFTDGTTFPAKDPQLCKNITSKALVQFPRTNAFPLHTCRTFQKVYSFLSYSSSLLPSTQAICLFAVFPVSPWTDTLVTPCGLCPNFYNLGMLLSVWFCDKNIELSILMREDLYWLFQRFSAHGWLANFCAGIVR